MRRFAVAVCLLVSLFIHPRFAAGQHPESQKPPADTKTKAEPKVAHAEAKEEAKAVTEEKKGEPAEGKDKEIHFDMTEVAPVVTHHQITLDGKTLKYTATAGRLPIKSADGKTEAEMFFVAYTLDGAEASRRPLTFAFNGGPGSASVWLHMGALGPRRVVLQPEGFMPAAPYHMADNQHTALDRTDLVMVDAVGTGFSRAANLELHKKFWGVKGDIEAFGEFIRLYLTRYERWPSPLYLLGESYGTTRAAGVSGWLADRGITFNGIVLLSTILDFQTVVPTKHNDEAYVLTLPTFTNIAAYHKKLPADLLQDMGKTRQEAIRWATTDYAQALAKGDALTAQERQTVVAQMARYTGLTPQFVDQANLRVNVAQFTHNLLIDQKLRVGRLDGRFTGTDPDGLLDTPFFDPTASSIMPPYTAVFNNYVRTELGYKSDMPYYVFAQDVGFEKWDWGSAVGGFPETAQALREAMAKNPYLKVLVMEGYYDLATPFYAADYAMNHMDLPPNLRSNISFATYEAGHMVYTRMEDLAKMKRDFATFIEQSLPTQ